jgi:hypothetical protein
MGSSIVIGRSAKLWSCLYPLSGNMLGLRRSDAEVSSTVRMFAFPPIRRARVLLSYLDICDLRSPLYNIS